MLIDSLQLKTVLAVPIGAVGNRLRFQQTTASSQASGSDLLEQASQVWLDVRNVFSRGRCWRLQKATVQSSPGQNDTTGLPISMRQQFFTYFVVAIAANNLTRILQNCLLQRATNGRKPVLQGIEQHTAKCVCKG
jgi:hypothetical protein